VTGGGYGFSWPMGNRHFFTFPLVSLARLLNSDNNDGH
jgi:hypothetical protein